MNELERLRDNLQDAEVAVFQALRAQQEEIAQLKLDLASCPICGHPWQIHDPEDGACDSHSSEDDVLGPCRCGRDLAFATKRNAELSRKALGGGE